TIPSAPELRVEVTLLTAGVYSTRTGTVINVNHSRTTVIEADGVSAEDGDDAVLQLAFPGIGRSDSPVTKVGQSESSATNPISQSVENVSYVSLQTNDRNRGYAIVMRPAGSGSSTLLSLDDGAMSERLPR